MALYLEPLNGGRQIVLDKAVVLVGRQEDCDVVLNNSRKVSRKHCCIAQVNDRFVVRDLASMNGVRINGKRVDRESPLAVGDEVSFGDIKYVLCDSNASNAPVSEDKGSAQPPDLPLKQRVVLRPVNISQKFPVPIEDEGVEFAVEPSAGPEESSAPGSALKEVEADYRSGPPPPAAAEDEDVPEAIILDDSDEFRPPGSNR